MKIAILCFCLVLPGAAQTSVTPTAPAATAPAATAPTQNLKEDFAKSVFRVLRKIEGDTSYGGISQTGEVTVPREINQAISDLDIDAQTKEDQAVVKVLNTFFNAKASHNMQIALLSKKVEILQEFCYNKSVFDNAVSESPMVAEIQAKEAACTGGLEAVLRARNYHDVEACSSTAQAVPGPDTNSMKCRD